ncbi:MAG: MarC family protein [Nanobdellota archaeon]
MMDVLFSLLVMLNPFAMFLYLQGIVRDYTKMRFFLLLVKASISTFVILGLFVLSGDMLFSYIFQVDIDTFRVFGGIVIASYGFLFIFCRQNSFIRRCEDMDDQASEIAFPFMVGAGTISVALSLSSYSHPLALVGVLSVLLVNILVVMFLLLLQQKLPMQTVVFDKVMGYLLRLNAFFIGAIGIDMIRIGLW